MWRPRWVFAAWCSTGRLLPLTLVGFARLQQRWPQNRRPTPALLRQVPVRLAAFDVVAIDGREITATVYERRRAVLDSVAAADVPGTLVVPRSWDGRLPCGHARHRRHRRDGGHRGEEAGFPLCARPVQAVG